MPSGCSAPALPLPEETAWQASAEKSRAEIRKMKRNFMNESFLRRMRIPRINFSITVRIELARMGYARRL
jgi:hypothetical protein